GLVEQQTDDARGFIEPRETTGGGREPEAVHRVLAFVPRAAEAEHRAAVRHVVERGDHLREHRWGAVRHPGYERAETAPRRECAPRREQLPGLEHRTVRIAVERDEVIPRP